MASSAGRQVWTDRRTGRTFHYDQQTGEIVYSDGSRVLAASQFAQPPANVPRIAIGAVRQQPNNAFSSQPYNQHYTNSPPVASGSSVQNVTQQLHSLKIVQPSTSAKSAIPNTTGRPIDGAEVLRNPPVRGTPPRRVPFTPTVQNGLLNPAFKVKERPTRYFVPGKVFLTLWTEATSVASTATTNKDVFAVAYGEHAFCRVRRFVVVRSGPQSCSALAVSTHSGKGSPQNNRHEHGVIYTGKSAPDTRNEPGLQPGSIRVNPDEKNAVLDPQSRINYGKLYNVEYNVKVKNFGSLSPEYLDVLMRQFSAVFMSRIRTTAAGHSDREDHPDMTENSPRNTHQLLDPTRRGAVEHHTRHVNNAAAAGRAAGSNTTGARGQRPTQEAVESDEEAEDDEEAGNPVEEESSDEDEDEEGDDDDDDDDDDDENDNEQ